MNIYIISPNKVWGGAATANLSIAEMLAVGNTVYYNDEYFSLARPHVIYDNYPTHQTKDSLKLVQHLFQLKIDVVIWGVAMTLPFYRKASAMLHKFGIVQVLLFHSLAIDSSLKGKLMEWLIAISLHHIDHLVFVSRFTDESWSRKYWWVKSHKSHHVIYNPICLDGQTQCLSKINPTRIGFVGRFSPEKQPELFARLSQDDETNSYIAWGEGMLLADLRNRYPRVFFKGQSMNQNAIYESFDILVLTSRFENCPMVILEARRRGIPCVAPRVGGIPEIVTHGVDGMLYDDYTPQTIHQFIGQIQDSYDVFSTHCLQSVQHYSYHTLYHEWMALLSHSK